MDQALLIIVCGCITGILLLRLFGTRPQDSWASGQSVIATDDPWENEYWDHQQHPYHCVSCSCDDCHSGAVDPFKGQYFLVRKSSELPVPKCTSMPCRCRYVHHADRRQEEVDRRFVYGLEKDLYEQTHDRDRRHSLGRRMEDWSVA